jgi:hypothetical protein
VREQGGLIRFVRAPDGTVLVDYRHKLPGRGAYTCLSRSCLERAVSRRQFDRAFKAPCQPLTAAALSLALTQAIAQRLAALLGMARKSSQLLSGGNQVLDALDKPREIAAVILADDISAGVAEKLTGKASGGGVPCLRFATKADLGQLIGRGERSVAALLKGPLAEAFMAEWQRYQAINAECAGDIG